MRSVFKSLTILTLIPLLVLSGCTPRQLKSSVPEVVESKAPPEVVKAKTTEVEYTEHVPGPRSYIDASVSGLPVEEQIKIARCVELSSIVRWGEGGPMYTREVAQAFMLDYPSPDFLIQLEEEFGIYKSPHPGEVAFLVQYDPGDYHPMQHTMGDNRWREIWFYTGSDTFQIHLTLDSDMNILDSWAVRMTNEYPWTHPFELSYPLRY